MPELSHHETQAALFEPPRIGVAPAAYWKRRIGRRIHLAREESGGRNRAHTANLSREMLAQRLGIPARRLWEIENGLWSVDGVDIARIAEQLCVHPGYFFDQGPWSDWALDHGTRTAWLLTKTIGEMDAQTRQALEQLILCIMGAARPGRMANQAR